MTPTPDQWAKIVAAVEYSESVEASLSKYRRALGVGNSWTEGSFTRSASYEELNSKLCMARLKIVYLVRQIVKESKP